MTDVFLNPEQVAKILGLSAYTVREYARKGILTAHKVGRSWRFSRASVEDWVLSSRARDLPAGDLSLRDASYASCVDCSPKPIIGPKDPLGFAERNRRAVETFLAIRDRGRKESVEQIVRESRRELMDRGRRIDGS